MIMMQPGSLRARRTLSLLGYPARVTRKAAGASCPGAGATCLPLPAGRLVARFRRSAAATVKSLGRSRFKYQAHWAGAAPGPGG